MIATATAIDSREIHYEVRIEGLGSLEILDVDLEEGASALSQASLRFRVPLARAPEPRTLFGKAVHLGIWRTDGMRRSFRGVVRSAQSEVHGGSAVVSVDVASALWLLSQTRDSRIYQDVTAPELATNIVRELLGVRGVEVESALTQRYPRHEYLVQHRESHLEFLVRVLHDEGIWFVHEVDDDRDLLVLCDTNQNRPTIENGDRGIVRSVEARNPVGREHARPIRMRGWLGPTSAAVAGFDWTNPDLPVAASEALAEGPPLEVYEHDRVVRHHDYESDQYRAHTAARQALHQRERIALSRESWVVSTNVVNASPGRLIEIVGDGEHDGRYLVLGSRLGGAARDGTSLRNELRLIPIDQEFRPPVGPRRTMPGPETATVVGPAGEDVHVDPHGRVRVRFHWDRRASEDGRSSAWIRVSQAWAGPGHGAVFLPRVGSEVIVSFLGGDPDRPVITGSLYNGRNRAPLTLPDDKTRSGFFTRSTPGGSAGNELSFEDRAGAEQIRMRAVRDLEIDVQRDAAFSTGGSRSVRVQGDQSVRVRGGSSMAVDGVARMKCGGVETLIGTDDRRVVGGGVALDVAGGSDTRIVGGERRVVHGGSSLELTGPLSQMVRGPVEERVEGDVLRTARALEQIVEGAMTLRSEGPASLTSSALLEVVADALGLRSATTMTLDAVELKARVESMVVEADRVTSRAREITAIAERSLMTARTAFVSTEQTVRQTKLDMSRVETSIGAVGTEIRSASVSLMQCDLLVLG